MTKRILIACPTATGQPDQTAALSIVRALGEAAAQGWNADHLYRSWDSMITRARDVLFSVFYGGDYTDMLFLDDDIGAPVGAFTRIMEHEADVVGIAYRGKGDREEFVVRPLPDGIMQIDPAKKLIEVEAVGTGYLRITRAAAQRIVSADPDAWYRDHTAPEGLKIWSVFDNFLDRESHQKWSEDYYFCRKWRALGGKVWVDPVIPLSHAGKKVFEGCLFDYLQRKCVMSDPATQGKPSVASLAKMFVEAAESGPA